MAELERKNVVAVLFTHIEIAIDGAQSKVLLYNPYNNIFMLYHKGLKVKLVHDTKDDIDYVIEVYNSI